MRSLDDFPRYPLTIGPTPLEEAHRLSEQLGVRLLLKRDDLTGFAAGGNKARKLEFILADALRAGADTVLTGARPQSNFIRMAAAAARKVGLDPVAVVSGKPPAEVQGNLLLDYLLDTEVIYTGSEDRDSVDAVVETVRAGLVERGRRPYVIARGGADPLGCLGYVACSAELLKQLADLDLRPDYLVCAAGSCGTQAGLLLGARILDAPFQVVGIAVGRPAAACAADVARLVASTAALLERPSPVTPEDIVVHDRYIGPGYGVSTPESLEAIRRVARSEGVFLDPVYTAKAMAGLVDLVGRGEIPQGATVIFLHTGGLPSLFAHARDFGFDPTS